MIKYLNLLVEYICKECDLKFTTKDGMDLHKSVFHKKESKPKKAKKLVATDYGYPDKTGRYLIQFYPDGKSKSLKEVQLTAGEPTDCIYSLGVFLQIYLKAKKIQPNDQLAPLLLHEGEVQTY